MNLQELKAKVDEMLASGVPPETKIMGNIGGYDSESGELTLDLNGTEIYMGEDSREADARMELWRKEEEARRAALTPEQRAAEDANREKMGNWWYNRVPRSEYPAHEKISGHLVNEVLEESKGADFIDVLTKQPPGTFLADIGENIFGE